MNNKILLVDDESHVLAAIKRALFEEPLEIITVSSGEDALETLKEHQFKVVISDERMVGMQGSELLAKVRETYPDTIRIMLTGHATLEAAMKAVNEGEIYRFFAKPWNDNDLVFAIRSAIEKFDLEAENRRLQSFLKQIIDGSSVPTFVINQEHYVTHWNHACEVVTGLAANDVVGTRDQWRSLYMSEQPVMADLILSRAREKNIDPFYYEKFRPSELVEGAYEVEDFFPQLGKDGRWLFFTAAPLNDASGELIGVIETLQDITEQKRAEQALRESEDKYRIMSITDGLTKLYNSRHFYDQIGVETDRSQRYDRPLSLLLFDLDNFKKINDTYGHLEGDRVLEAVSGVIKSNLRTVDTAYRYGGEEFTVLLPETGIETAVSLAERLRQNIATILLKTASGTDITITVSIGVAEYDASELVNSFVRRADDGVYEAKRKGKNQVIAISYSI